MFRKGGILLFLLYASILSAQQKTVLEGINISGNKRTNTHIITRELNVAIGDSILIGDLNNVLISNQQLIFNLGLFNFVSVDTLSLYPLYLEIKVAERWYFWPYPILEYADPNFNVWWSTKDLTRINYGMIAFDRNFEGRNQRLGLILQGGYARQLGVIYDNPGFKKQRRIGGGFSLLFKQTSEIPIGTVNNLRNLVHISGSTRTDYKTIVHLSLSPSLYQFHKLQGAFERIETADTIKVMNADYLSNGTTSLSSFRLNYGFKLDRRDRRFYPLNGYFAEIEWDTRLMFLERNLVNQAWLEVKYYQGISSRIFVAAGAFGKAYVGKQPPYALQRCLGYNKFVRGYEYYVVDGKSYFLAKGNIKYLLLDKKGEFLSFFNHSGFNKYFLKVFANIFMDVGYVDDPWYGKQMLGNHWMRGVGVGLDFVTIYDKTLRLEVTRNAMNKTGFFVHFIQPI